MPLSSFTFHKFWTRTNRHTNCTCDCECLFAGVLQALQSWKTQICPEGEHPASLELWSDSFSAFRYVCVRSCAWTSLCSSRAPFTNVFERARSKLVCLIQSCVCLGGGFASLIPLHLFFSFLQGSLTPTSLDFSRFFPPCMSSLTAVTLLPGCPTLQQLGCNCSGFTGNQSPQSQTLQNQTLYGICQICNLAIAICMLQSALQTFGYISA